MAEQNICVKDVLHMAAKNGYKAYWIKNHSGFGYLITPSGNILTVNRGDYGGVRFTFEYVPSKENGWGCACLSSDMSDRGALFNVDIKTLQAAEESGLMFARELGAKLYYNSDKWLKDNYWNKQGLLREVIA